MNNRLYASYLILAILGGAFGAFWNFFFLTDGFYHPYVSVAVVFFAFIWLAVNLSIIFLEGVEENPDIRKLFLPFWYVVGFVITGMYAAFNLKWAPSWIAVGTTFSVAWVTLAIVGAIFELVYADLLLLELSMKRAKQ